MQNIMMTTNNAQPNSSNKGVGAASGSLKGLHANNSGTNNKVNPNSQTTSGKNVRSMSLNKRLAMGADIQNANATIDIGALMYPTNQLGGPINDLNNSAIVQQQFNTLMANNQMINRGSVQNKPKDGQANSRKAA